MELGLNAVAGPQENSFWNDDVRQRKFKRITPTVMRGLGLKSSDIKMVKTLEELKESPPNIIIAKAAKHTSFVQNWFKEQSLHKKQKYVMGLGVFQQLHFNTKSNQKLLRPGGIKFKNLYKPYVGQPVDGKTVLVFVPPQGFHLQQTIFPSLDHYYPNH